MIEVKTPRSSLAALALLALIGPPSVAAASEVAAAPDRGWQHQELAGDVYYQVFVRSFVDSDGDGAGDLSGLTSRLDYLNDGDPATSRSTACG